MARICGHCESDHGYCVECGTCYDHGDAGQCTRPRCKSMNAPIDCTCGLVLCSDGSGVLDHNMNLIPWQPEGHPAFEA